MSWLLPVESSCSFPPPLENVGNRFEAPMWMIRRPERAAGRVFDRSYLIQQQERAHLIEAEGRHGPAHSESGPLKLLVGVDDAGNRSVHRNFLGNPALPCRRRAGDQPAERKINSTGAI